MSGLRKFSAAVLWVILIMAIVLGFLWFSGRNMGSVDSLSILPGNSAIIFECSDFPKLVAELHSGNKMWNEISASGLLDDSAIGFTKLDSILKKNTQIRGFFSKKFTISVSLKTNKTPGLLFCLPVSARNQEKLFLNSLSKHLGEFNYTRRRFESRGIYDLSWKDSTGIRNFSFTEIGGALVGSFAAELVEETILQYDPDKNLTTSGEFNSIAKTIGNNVPVHIFVNYKNTAGIISYFLNSSLTKARGAGSLFASYAALDAEISEDKIIINGFASISDSINQELKILINQQPVEFNCPDFLPDAVSYFQAFGFSDNDLFFKHLSGFMQKDPFSAELIKKKKELISAYGIDLDKGFSEMVGNEFGFAGMQTGRTSSPFFFMEIRSQSLAEQQFLEWLGSWAQKNGKRSDELMLDHKIDNNNKIRVYKLPVGGIPALVFGSGFDSPGNDYFTFINNYLVFANSYSSIKEFIYQVILGNTLSSGPSYSSLGENISSRSNYYFFAKPAAIAESGEGIFSEKTNQFLQEFKKGISKFNAVSMQFSAADEMFYNHFLISYSGVSSGSVNTVWTSRLDTSIVVKPAIVLNHLTGEKEIFIQDQKNQVYLLSNAGIILWKQLLDSPVNSEIFQVDYFKNGKLQYLFSTRNKIYMIDRNGNPVEKYPVDLRSPATAGISVFDYDRDGSIRICIPGEDRKIYMYDKEGKIIPGWQAEKTDNIVSQAIQHFRIGSKDYVVAIDKYKFYILDRRGSNRVAVKQYFQVSAKNGFYLDISRGEGLARLVTTDTSGSIHRVYFSGKVEKILDRKENPDHFFVFTDLDGDQKGEFITASGSTLKVLDPALEESFSLEFNDSISFRPVVYRFSATNNKIGIVLRNQGNIYLYNNNGTLYNGFPLDGASPFSISSFPELGGRFNMIVGSKNNFLHNYSVQ